MMKLFGRRAHSFLAQEFQLTPSYASLLAQSDYNIALHRIQNKGATVYSQDVSILWEAPDGQGIKTIPSHYDDSQQAISTGFTHWPELITETAKHYPMGIYTNLLDIVWITMFREEAVRSAWYSQVLGSFVTYQDLEKMIQPSNAVGYSRQDYLPEMQPGTSQLLSEMWNIGRQLESMEKYFSIQGDQSYSKQVVDAWNGLGEFVNHDNTVCFHVRPKDQTHLPFSTGPDRRGPELYDVLRDMVKNRMSKIFIGANPMNYLFNPLNQSKDEVLIKRDNQWITVKRLLDVTSADSVAYGSFPPLSTAAYPEKLYSPVITTPSNIGITTKDLCVSLDPESGSISDITYRDKKLTNGNVNRVVVGLEGSCKLIHWQLAAFDGLSVLTCKLALAYEDGRPGGEALTSIAIPDSRPIIYFTTKVFPVNQERKLYRTYHADRNDSIGVQFDLDSSYSDVRDCWMHHIHERNDGKEREYGPGLYYGNRTLQKQYVSKIEGEITQSAMGLVLHNEHLPSIILHNDGSTIYEVNNGIVKSLLWCNYEYGDQFSYALEVIDELPPYEAMLAYQYELLPVPEAIVKDPPKVTGAWLSALYEENNEVYARIVETTGEHTNAELEINFKYGRVCLVNVLGDEIEELKPSSPLTVPLTPYGFTTVRFTY